jgi:hypothetical protein
MAQPPGRPRLYMPDRIVTGLPDAFGPQDAPLVPAWHPFPFPVVQYGGPLSNTLMCKPLVAAAVKTEGGVTKTAAQVLDMPPADRLRRVRRCIPLWENLTVYCLPNGPGVARVSPPGHFHGNPATIHTCQGVGPTVGLPLARQQADVLDRLYPWFIAHDRRRPAAMTSEPSVQDEVHAQIVEPLNMLLEVCNSEFCEENSMD